MKNILYISKLKKASNSLSQKSDKDKNFFLKTLAATILKEKSKILKANKRDVTSAIKKHLQHSFIERLTINEKEIYKIIKKIHATEQLKSGLGEIIENRIIQNGVRLKKIRVPIGVIAIIYEARPEVTIDVAILCIKSGNIAILKGGSEALQTNRALYLCIVQSLKKSAFDKHIINFINSTDRKIVHDLLKRNDLINLIIARGSYEMVKSVMNRSDIPVLAHSAGGARIYIDKSADLKIVEGILINSKTSKPSACNSLDTVILHKALVYKLLPELTKSFDAHQIEIIDNVWDKEFLDLKVSIKIVKDVTEAITFINHYGKQHSEGIIAKDKKTINEFVTSIDAAALFVNCSPRLHDGYVFGLGSEIGIASGKLHARGPVGLKELTTYKWVAYGKGQIRQ